MQTAPKIAELTQGIERAAACRDPELLREFITRALSEKRLHEIAAQPLFREQVLRVSEGAHGRGEQAVSAAIAELGRLQSYLRPSDHWPVQFAVPLLSCGFKPSPSFGTADQRLHIAQVVAKSTVDIALNAVAMAAVEERTAEKVRRVWMQLLTTRLPLSAVLGEIATAMRASNDKSILSADSWLKRLDRILTALNIEVSAAGVKVDADLSASLSRFVSSALSRSSTPPRDYDVSSTAGTALLNFAQHLIQLSVRLGVDSSFYRALASGRNWFPDGGWIRFTRESGALKSLRKTLLDGILLLLEQSKPDEDLLTAHRNLCPDADAAKAELRDLESQSRHLSAALRQWLRTSGRKRPPAKATELTQTDDLAVAFALISSRKIRQQAESDIKAVLYELDITIPIQAHTLRQYAKDVMSLVDRIETLARRRRLKLFGTCGEIVDYSPHAYKLAQSTGLTRRVRVTSPGVEQSGTQTSRVLIHALVEPLAPPVQE